MKSDVKFTSTLETQLSEKYSKKGLMVVIYSDNCIMYCIMKGHFPERP